MKRILFFGRRRYPNDHAVLENVFTRHLPDYGYETVWVLQPGSPEYSDTRQTWNGTPVYVIPMTAWGGLKHRWQVTREYLRVGEVAMQEHEVDIVQGRSGSLELLAAWWLARKHNKPFVIQYSFPLPMGRREKLRSMGLGIVAEPWYFVEERIIRWFMRQAALTLTISENMRDIYAAVGVRNLSVLPLGADTDIQPEDVTPIDAAPDTVLYFGSMNVRRKMSFLIDVFALVKQQVPSAHLLMLGSPDDPQLHHAVAHYGLRGAVTFAGDVPRRDVPRYIRAARCTVAPIVPTSTYTLSSPTKVFESLAMGVPVVANEEIHAQREVLQASGGGVLTPYTVPGFADGIIRLLRDPHGAVAMGRAGLNYIRAHYSYLVLSKALAADYDTMLARFERG